MDGSFHDGYYIRAARNLGKSAVEIKNGEFGSLFPILTAFHAVCVGQ